MVKNGRGLKKIDQDELSRIIDDFLLSLTGSLPYIFGV